MKKQNKIYSIALDGFRYNDIHIKSDDVVIV